MMKKMLLALTISSCVFLFIPGNPSFAGDTSALKAYRKANKLFEAKKYPDAIVAYQQVLAAVPEDVQRSDIHTRVADSYFNLGNFHQARDSYQQALRDQERAERPQTQYWIGFCSFLLGRDAEAIKEFLKIPELYPESGMWVPTAYYWAGRASERVGNKERAAEYYQKAGGNRRSAQGRVASERAKAIKEKP